MRFAHLASGSRGNALVVSHGATHVLVDCGLSLRRVTCRLAELGLAPEVLAAILVTHEHGDHASGVRRLAEAHSIPVFASAGTARAAGLEDLLAGEPLHAERPFTVGELEIHPYTVPHDAREPLQFVFGDGRRRLGVLTDCGHPTPHVRAALDGCHALVLECNHDPEALAQGSYPPPVKARVGGDWGHLSNPQAAALLTRLDTTALRHVVAAHLSERHNTPQQARRALAASLDCPPEEIHVACQDGGTPWLDLN